MDLWKWIQKMSGFCSICFYVILHSYHLNIQAGKWLEFLANGDSASTRAVSTVVLCHMLFYLQFYSRHFLTFECFQNWFASYNEVVHMYTTKIIGIIFQKLHFLHLAGKGQYENWVIYYSSRTQSHWNGLFHRICGSLEKS